MEKNILKGHFFHYNLSETILIFKLTENWLFSTLPLKGGKGKYKLQNQFSTRFVVVKKNIHQVMYVHICSVTLCNVYMYTV